jgi:uncharacterized repeat protein (TIGR01451 family)
MKEPRQNRRDLLLILLLVPLGMLCMFLTGQMAIQLKPLWQLEADLRSLLNPTANFLVNDQGLFEPVNTDIPPAQHRPDFLLTPSAIIPTSAFIVIPTPVRKEDTPIPTLGIVTPVLTPPPTPTTGGPIIVPTSQGPSQADLVITKTDRSPTYTPGTSISYTIVVTNRGPDRAPRFDVNDDVPAEITVLNVDCTPAIRCGTNTSSGNNISFTNASLFRQQEGVYQITITISGTVASGASGNLSNTANVVIPSGSRYRDPDMSNNSVTDTDTQLSVYDLAITKNDGVDSYTATNPLSYSIVVTNAGPSDAVGVRVVDNIPPQIASWTWTCATVTDASGCNGITNSTAGFNDLVNIQVGGRIEYTVTANPALLPPTPQNLTNTVSVLLPGGPSYNDPNLSNNTATDTDIPYIDLQITKDDGTATYAANGTVTYTITVTNNSTFDVNGITVSDPKPARVTTWSWDCGGGSCTPVTDSNTDFMDTINLTATGTPGDSLTYTVTANISGNANPGNLTNIATVSVPAGLVEAVPADNSATDVDVPYIDLQITKTDVPVAPTYTPGSPLTYNVTVTNTSTFNLTGVTVTDNRPALIDPTTWNWTCGPNPPPPGATCATPSGTGNINTTVDLPAGTSVIFTINTTVRAEAAGTLDNTATVSPPASLTDVDTSNNTATDSDVSSVGEPDVGPPDGNIYEVPEGTSATFFLSQPIVADGDGAADFVFYESPMAPGIALDQVIIEISSDGSTWLPVFNWGDGNADTNTNVNINLPNIASACTPNSTEEDNCPINSGDLYNNTGITIDVDNSPLSPVPAGNYRWIRFTAPAGSGDAAQIDAIQILP